MSLMLLGTVSAYALEAGDAVPDIAVASTSGGEVNLRDVPGWKVVYFYPKSFTGGCTKQACGMRDAHGVYRDLDALVFGVSTDNLDTQKRFKEEYGLPFDLLADEDKKLAKAFGVLNLVGMAGRTTFIVNGQGVITDVIDSVNVGTHDRDIAAILRERLAE